MTETRYAPVVPARLALLMKRAEEDSRFPVLGDYHLLLAHDVAAVELYEDVYSNEDHFIIMDNSMVELGAPVGEDVMRAALLRVYSDCFVLPDVRYEMQQTIDMSIKAAKEWQSCVGLVKDPNQPFMVVPQGKDLAEYVECTKRLMEIDGASWIGIPRSVYSVLGGRLKLVNAISEILFFTEPYIHLLGFSPDLADDVLTAQHHTVMGIDSAVPPRMGQAGTVCNPKQRDPGPRGSFWEKEWTWLTPQTVLNMTMIRRWINVGFEVK